MELMNCILNRRSGRNYNDRQIPPETIDRILEAGLLAPSSRNLRSTELITVTKPDVLAKLAQAKVVGGGMLKDAAAAIVIIGKSAQSDAWIEDGSIAMTQMMLRATELGIANCWVHFRNRFSNQECSGEKISADTLVRELLGISGDYSVLAALSLGMADEVIPARTAEEAEWNRVHREQF